MAISTKLKKLKTVAKLREEAAVLLQKLVRMKAADENGLAECVTCGKRQHYKEMDGGHFISRKWTATKLVEENVHPQCKGTVGDRCDSDLSNGSAPRLCCAQVDECCPIVLNPPHFP